MLFFFVMKVVGIRQSPRGELVLERKENPNYQTEISNTDKNTREIRVAAPKN